MQSSDDLHFRLFLFFFLTPPALPDPDADLLDVCIEEAVQHRVAERTGPPGYEQGLATEHDQLRSIDWCPITSGTALSRLTWLPDHFTPHITIPVEHNRQ